MSNLSHEQDLIATVVILIASAHPLPGLRDITAALPSSTQHSGISLIHVRLMDGHGSAEGRQVSIR
jgi:hypothetical protein